MKQESKGKYFNHGWPSSRLLIEQIVTFGGENSTTLTHMHMQWGQFLDYDIDLLGMFDVNCTELNNDNQYCMPIRVKQSDRIFGISSVNKARYPTFTRSLPVCHSKQEHSSQCRHCRREHINRITHYIDASMIYGSNNESEMALRSFSGGLLKTKAQVKEIYHLVIQRKIQEVIHSFWLVMNELTNTQH